MKLENGEPKWSEIALAGQSQGGGMSAFIAKDHVVARVIDFSGGWDYSAKGKIAKWYFKFKLHLRCSRLNSISSSTISNIAFQIATGCHRNQTFVSSNHIRDVLELTPFLVLRI